MEEPSKVKTKSDLTKRLNRCGTCQRVRVSEGKTGGRKGGRKRTGFECAVLLRMIGQVKECSFWTDDPEWEEKARQAARYYYYDAQRKRSEGSAYHHVG